MIEQELANIVPQRETLLVIGVFDGVHTGHRYLLENLKRRAQERNLLAGVVTFDPHPQSVLNPHNQLPRLSSVQDRVDSIRKLHIDLVVVLPFTPEVSQLSARDFVSLLNKYLKMRGIIIGPDFTLGRDREGDANLLRALGQEMDFSVEQLPPFAIDGEIVSSTLIRQSLAQGDMRKVEKLMGRRFHLRGKIVSSDKRGRTLGFPTANLDAKPQQALPGNGVYATIAQADRQQFLGATNVGTHPTFGNSEKRVETHLLNYQGDLYGKEIVVEFVQKLRDEQRFASPEELKAQMKKDIQEAKTILAERTKID